MKKNILRKASLLLMSVLIAAMTLCSLGCGKAKPITATTTDQTIEGCEIGVGNTTFTFVVVDGEGKETTFTVNTDETTVGAALVKVNLIAGEDSDYGLYVKIVNGITADWNIDGHYWAFYINGEYAMTGVDSTEIAEGATYSFKVE